MKNFWFGLILLVSGSCMKGKQVDLIVHNAKIHCMDDQNTVEDAMAIKDGKIVEVGPERQILNKYRADEIQDAEQRDVYPGFTDAHTHMFSLAKQNLGVDLTDCKSMDINASKLPCNVDCESLFPKPSESPNVISPLTISSTNFAAVHKRIWMQSNVNRLR